MGTGGVVTKAGVSFVVLLCSTVVCLFVFVMFSSRDKEKQGQVKRFFVVKHEFKP